MSEQIERNPFDTGWACPHCFGEVDTCPAEATNASAVQRVRELANAWVDPRADVLTQTYGEDVLAALEGNQ